MMRTAASIVALLVVAAWHRPAAACRREPLGLARAYAAADAVFVGRVVAEHKSALNPKQCARHPDWCVYAFTYDVAVEEIWKGAPPPAVTILAGSGRGDCSFGSLAATDRWVFMATGTSGSLTVRHGQGTAPATAEEIAELTGRYGLPTPRSTPR